MGKFPSGEGDGELCHSGENDKGGQEERLKVEEKKGGQRE
jgi:hypothetical protein